MSKVKIEVYINGELRNTMYNEYVAMCNVSTYRKLYGDENVTVKRIEIKTKEEE